MSTLTTRIGGFRVVIRKATDVEREEFVTNSLALFAREVDGTNAHVGTFVDDEGNERSDALPYDLRGMILTIQPETIIGTLTHHLDRWTENEDHHMRYCEDGSNCERCRNFDANIDRRYTTLRGQFFEFEDRKFYMQADRSRRAWKGIRECAICQNGTLNCDEHSMALALLHAR